MQAVINASAEGTRLRPLTCGESPAMLPVLGRPALFHLIEKLKKHSVTDIIIMTGYMQKSITELLGGGEELGVNIKYISASDGECAAIKKNSDMLKEEFLYFSFVGYSDADFTKAVEFHREKEAFATILMTKDSSLGRISADKNGRITRFEEKKLWSILPNPPSGTGIYILKRDIVRFIPEESSTDMAEAVLPSLVRAGKSIYAAHLGEKSEDMCDFSSYMRANFTAAEGICKRGAYVEEGAQVETGALLESPCYIAKGAHIAKGAKIYAYSVIGKNTRVAAGVSVKRSVVGEGCTISKDAALRGCILGRGVRVGSGTSVYEQAVVGDGTKLGRDCAVRSFVRIWPEKNVDDGQTVSENIMWGQKKRVRLFEDDTITGVVNEDITPGFCLRLGECVGTVSDMGEIGVSSDGSASSSMLRDALVSGILGTGARVRDFGEQPLPITRRGVAFYMMAGGVAINTYEQGGEEHASLTVIDKGGIDAGEKLRARLESLFEKGDFMRSEPKEISEREYFFEYKLYYLKNLINSTSRKKASLKLLISCPAQWGRRLLAGAAADFDCKATMFSPSGETNEEDFSSAVAEGGFDIGFIIDRSCERLKIVNCDGRIIEDEDYEAFYSLIVMKKYPSCKIYVPVTASEAIETLAEKYGAEVIRTKTEPYEIMEHIIGGEEYLSDQFVFRFDAVGAVIKVLDFISAYETTLTELLSLLPKISMAKAEVEIKNGSDIYSALGRIYSLDGAEQSSPEGVRVTFDKGWVVVIPDSYKKVCRVVAEGRTEEFARELCDFCIDEMLR